jgi:virginiamycin B lyase
MTSDKIGVGARAWCCVLVVAIAVALVILVIALESRVSAGAGAHPSSTAGVGGESYVYYFDPATSAFVFTFTVPTAGANPWDIAVVSGIGHQEVWFTENGADRIGRLTYTDTHTYGFREYTLTVGSQPLNLVSGGGFIWFTQPGRDRIGRLDPATGQIAECEASAGSYPADLDYASDGSIWFTEMAAGRVAHLTMAGGCVLVEYSGGTLAGGQPYGIVVVDGSLYLAQTANDRVTRFTPPSQWVDITGIAPGIPDEPYRLTVDSSGRVWGTERTGNRVSQFEYGTFPVVAPYSLSPANSLPTGIVADADRHLWFTQWRVGRMGRLIPGGSPQKDYYQLPLADLSPTGIAADSMGGIWVLASQPHRIYLPAIMRSWGGG